MQLLPQDLQCEICEAQATVQLHDTSTGADHAYCTLHAPDPRPGKNRHLVVRRHRMEPGSSIAKALAADQDSPEHRFFRIEMCEQFLLGGEGACKYYLSRLTNSDQFSLWSDEFIVNAREFVLAETKEGAVTIPFEPWTIDCMEPLFRQAFEETMPSIARKQTKQDRAVVMLLNHPEWSDRQIADAVSTTLKQLQRNVKFTALRTYINRATNSIH